MIKVLIVSTLVFISGIGVKKNLKINVEKSAVNWIGKKVTGQHDGTIQLREGYLETDGDGNLTGGTFTMDMTTISNDDLSGDSKEKLEGHLKSDDFFGVAAYPTSTFVITKSVPQGSNRYKIVGDITIKGTTEEIQFPATIREEDDKIIATADIAIDRSKFDIRYGSGSFFDNLGDKTIYDNFDLSVSIVADK